MTSALRWGVWSAPSPGRFTPGKEPVPIVQETVWAPGPVWTGAENLPPTGIRSPDRPARSDYPIPAPNVLFNTSYFPSYIRSVVLNFHFIFGPISSVLASTWSFPVFLYSTASIPLLYMTDLNFSMLRCLYFV